MSGARREDEDTETYLDRIRTEAEENAELRALLRESHTTSRATVVALEKVTQTLERVAAHQEQSNELLRQIANDRASRGETRRLLIQRITEPAALRWIAAIAFAAVFAVVATFTGLNVSGYGFTASTHTEHTIPARQPHPEPASSINGGLEPG